MNIKFTLSTIIATFFLASCRTSTVSSSSQILEVGDYQFTASSVEKNRGLCLFDGISSYKGDRQPDKLLVIQDKCAILSEVMNPIYVDANVDLSVADYSELLMMLRNSVYSACKKSHSVPIVICLNDDLLNSVTKENSEYIFWYGRMTEPGSKGVGVHFVRNNGRFEFSKIKRP